MHVTVKLHAQAADLAGTRESRAEIDSAGTCGDVKRALAEAHPGLEPLVSSCALATESEYLPESAPVADGAVLHLIPPVSGG